MVWIHGGSFTGGSGYSKIYGPGYLLDRDIVLVTINYRLKKLFHQIAIHLFTDFNC